jgi:3-keto-L-gulonate-6-phosphate decarboxylase
MIMLGLLNQKVAQMGDIDFILVIFGRFFKNKKSPRQKSRQMVKSSFRPVYI